MQSALIFLAGLALLNLWATHRVLRYAYPTSVPRGLLVAGVWIIPFMGVFIACNHTPAPVAGRHAGTPPPRPPLPELLPGTAGRDFTLAEHMVLVQGWPMMDWAALQAWADDQPGPEAAVQALHQGRRAWLDCMARVLGPWAAVHESPQALILSTLPPAQVQAAARYVGTARRRIQRVLGSLAQFPPQQRSVLLVLDDESQYYQYVSLYYPAEGEFAVSGGMFIDAGCPHFVLVRSELDHVEPVIAHELTHSALAHLRLPKWLDEGLAVNTEHRVAGAKRLLYTPHQLHDMHLHFWNSERIQQFWSGASFDRTDHGNLLSYELARIIVEQLGRRWDDFAAFVAAARREDAGAAAAQAHLQLDLGACAAALLEFDSPAHWAPEPSSWAQASPA